MIARLIKEKRLNREGRQEGEEQRFKHEGIKVNEGIKE
jgi:hypothetical protein